MTRTKKIKAPEALEGENPRKMLWRLRVIADRYKVSRHPDLAVHFRVLCDQMHANATMTEIMTKTKLHKRYLEALEIMALN